MDRTLNNRLTIFATINIPCSNKNKQIYREQIYLTIKVDHISKKNDKKGKTMQVDAGLINFLIWTYTYLQTFGYQKRKLGVIYIKIYKQLDYCCYSNKKVFRSLCVNLYKRSISLVNRKWIIYIM